MAIPEQGDELVFSGSAVVDKDNTSGFGTRANPPMVAIYTGGEAGLAGAGAGLQHRPRPHVDKRYAGNPVLDIGSGEFRDPKVFWYAPAHEWVMVVSKAVERKIAIYSSPNLKDWTHLSDFGPANATGGVWECPDLFPLAVDGNRQQDQVGDDRQPQPRRDRRRLGGAVLRRRLRRHALHRRQREAVHAAGR